MYDGLAGWADSSFALSQQVAGKTMLVSLSGDLGIAHVEVLAACADEACGLPVRYVRMDVAALKGVDDAGARTLAAACQCLRLHGRRVEVQGIRPAVRRVLDRLGLSLAGCDGPLLDPAT
jgi:anti-anti-sigma regulatory factor